MKFGDFWKVYEKDMKPKLKYNTWVTKEYVVLEKILPYFKDIKMCNIKPRDIIQWQNTLRDYRDELGEPYAPTYLRTCQAQLSAIFNHAVRFYELKDNPVRKACPLGQGQGDEMKFWTKEEYLKFIPEVADKPMSYYAFELLYWCGIRMGELLALTPSDFDFKHNKLSITKSYQRIKGEENITKPKTKKSILVIVMPDMVSKC